ncbi:MAG: hypothetical protein QOI31_812 [Solirubrobacterales bacterium]|jgi:hypothetical protein|nr:hypothetical protein [Solirubrobacterales bacterium]
MGERRTRALSILVACLAGVLLTAPHATADGPAVQSFKLKASSSTQSGFAEGITLIAQRKGKRLRSYKGKVGFESSDLQAVLPPDYRFRRSDAGRHQFSVEMRTAGSQTVSAADPARPSATGERVIEVAPGDLHHLDVLPQGESLSPAVPVSLTADFALAPGAPPVTRSFSAEGRDEYENSLGDVTDTATFSLPTGSCAANACGNASPGPGMVTATLSGATGTALVTVLTVDESYVMSCHGENYDVNDATGDGCEQLQAHAGHTDETATFLGSKSCLDGPSATTVTGKLLSDTRTHSPAVAGFDTTAGAAPNHYRVRADGGVCSNDFNVTFTTTGGINVSCYRLMMVTDQGSHTIDISGSSTGNVSGGSGSYSDDTDIYFRVSKTCSKGIASEAVDYTIQFHL